ncbi:MAG: 3'(2'),5'-bisphosphate nucleotidase CysQ, partial [Acidobacteriota bacterium]
VDFLEEVWRIARQAGEEILRVRSAGEIRARRKDDASPVTDADLASEERILAGLEKLAPGIPCLSEEAAGAPPAEGRGLRRLFIVDPLDGTKEFVAGRDEFTVNIALVDRGEPVLGAVVAPALGHSYLGLAGAGAWRHDAAGRSALSASGSGREKLVIVASRSHRSPDLNAYLENLPAHELTEIGSSLKLCLVAEGRADFYPRLSPTMEWDVAAAHAVLRAAGGEVRVLDTGEPLRYDRAQPRNPFFVALGNRTVPWRQALPREIATSA